MDTGSFQDKCCWRIFVRQIRSTSPFRSFAGVDPQRCATCWQRIKRCWKVRDSLKATQLHEAVKQRDEELVEMVFSMKAEVNVEDKDGLKPLHAAVQMNQPKRIYLLVKRGAKINTKNAARNSLAQLTEAYDRDEMKDALRGKAPL